MSVGHYESTGESFGARPCTGPTAVMKRTTTAKAIGERVEANRSGIEHAGSFTAHRARLTYEIALRAPVGGVGRLCLLGAGNAHDVDLGVLGERFGEIHLVDIDSEALERARSGAPVAVRDRLHVHTPVDVSGSWDRLDEWSRRPDAAQTLVAEVAPAVARVVGALAGPFDVVVSCCMLTQLQLVVLDVVNDRHPAFDALRALTNAIHVRVLTGLLAPGGRALLVTDVTSDSTYPLDALAPDADLGRLMSDLVSVGNIVHAAHPGLLSAEIRRDPVLAAEFKVSFPVGPWLWHNGPEKTFLVYGLEIARNPIAALSAGSHTGPSGITSQTTPSPGVTGGRDMKVIEVDDVIPKLYQDQIEKETATLAWFFHPESARPDLEFSNSYGGFFHMGYDITSATPVVSAINAILVPVLFIFCDKANIKLNTLLRVRLGMFTKSSTDVAYHNPHVDFYEPHNVALYYVNDSDGDTVVFNETSDDLTLQQSVRYSNENRFTEIKRIAPKKGRMAWFDGKQYHASMHPMKHSHRIVVTFDFR